LKGYTALYVGGMGSRQQNFYNALATRMGFGEAATKIQDLYLDRRHRDAMAAVPFELVDQTALIGPRERIADRLQAYAQAGVTTVSIAPQADTEEQRREVMTTVAEAWSCPASAERLTGGRPNGRFRPGSRTRPAGG
jgi:alkanesulfonate monooxygenase SsuD/methylene tetrahydromethanopterin reductase-like flavin-dependent oxidoreductase (luciferase family)